jgi:hypothetical protein
MGAEVRVELLVRNGDLDDWESQDWKSCDHTFPIPIDNNFDKLLDEILLSVAAAKEDEFLVLARSQWRRSPLCPIVTAHDGEVETAPDYMPQPPLLRG